MFMSSPKIVTSQPLFVNNFILRRARVMKTMKTATSLLKQLLKTRKNLKELEFFVLKFNLYLYF